MDERTDRALAPVGPAELAAVLGAGGGTVDPRGLAWLAAQHQAAWGLLRRTTRDTVALGRILASVQEVLPRQHFVAFVGSLGLGVSTAYTMAKAARRTEGLSHVENIETSAVYVLTADTTPEEVRADFFRRAEAGEAVTLRQVRAVLAQGRGPALPARPNYPEQLVDLIVAAEEAGAGKNWRGKDVRAERIGREIGRFRADVRAEVAAAVDAWGRACVAAAANYLTEGSEPTT